MTDNMAVVRLRADLARQILAWMNDAFAKVDFDAPSVEVVEKLTLAWSDVLIRVEAVEQAALAAPKPQGVRERAPLTRITTRPSITMFDPVD
ncbi:hypothetical protein D3C80_1229580 [compost metagenome]